MNRLKEPQPPKGYHFVATFRYPLQVLFFVRLITIVCSIGVYYLASWGIIDKGIFQNVANLGAGVGTVVFIGIIGFTTEIVRGLIQRGINRLLGYDISFYDLFFSPLEGIFPAAPGQFQARRDALLVAITPLIILLLLWIPLLLGLSGIIAGALVFFLIANTLAAFWDLYFICWLLKKPKGTLLYVQGVLTLSVFERRSGSA